jgi:phosphatidylglycerol---prolipoprotein diacylglyceryl transferase
MIAYIHWRVSPEIFSFGPFAIRWYGLLFASGFLIGYYIMQAIYKREGKPVAHLDTLLWYVILGTVIGARLGHCLFYEPAYYLSNPIEILKIWEGGLASHGGTVGVLVALWLYSRRHPQEPLGWLADRLTIPTALTATLIRLGNLFNSEIYGKITTLPWAFVFERVDPHPRHPTQLYEASAYLLLFGVLLYLYRRHLPFWQKPYRPLGLFLLWVFGWRILIEFVKEPQASFEETLPLHMGQLLSIPFIALGLYFLFRPKPPTQQS